MHLRFLPLIRSIFVGIFLIEGIIFHVSGHAMPRSLDIHETVPEILTLTPLVRDESMVRYVSRDIALDDPTYRPHDLVPIASEYIDEKGRQSELRSTANDALQALAYAFYEHFRQKLIVVSAYRSADYQARLWDLGRCTDTLCAPP